MSEFKSYGLIAEFTRAEHILEAARRVRSDGYRRLEAYTPFPVEGLAEAVGYKGTRLPVLVFLGGLAGGAGGYFMQWYAAVVSYPLNVGGRPLHSWPAFIIPAFELTILGAAVAAFLGMLVLNGLPRLHHPVFDAPCFQLAMRNGFFLCVRSNDPLYDPQRTRQLLQSLQPVRVDFVPED